MNIRAALAHEIEIQESMGFEIPPRLLPELDFDLATWGDNQVYLLPKVDDIYLAHTLIAHNKAGLLDIFLAAEELCGGTYLDKISTIEHEGTHADAAMYAGQTSIRYTARIIAGPTFLHKGKVVRNLDIIPSFLMEDIHTTKLALATMLAAPEEPSDSDENRIHALGYKNSHEVRELARYYNFLAGEDRYFVNAR